MKKTIYSLAIMIMMVSSLCTFTSCGDDDVDTPVEVVKEATIKEVTFYMTTDPTEAMLKYGDLQVIYVSSKNDTLKGTVNEQNLKLKISFTEFPVSGTLKYIIKPKGGVKPTDDEILKVNRYMKVDKYYIMSDGTQKLANVPSAILGEVSLKGNQLADWMARTPALKEVAVSIDENGNIK